MSNWPADIHLLIPAYKAAESLSRFIPDLVKIVPQGQICVVDDASEDNTDQICARFNITCLKHPLNSGKGAALKTGFKHLLEHGSKWIITMDADGQHSLEDLPKFVLAIAQNPSMGICIGSREMKPGSMPIPRILSNIITSKDSLPVFRNPNS